jgi:hypothetical protein
VKCLESKISLTEQKKQLAAQLTAQLSKPHSSMRGCPREGKRWLAGSAENRHLAEPRPGRPRELLAVKLLGQLTPQPVAQLATRNSEAKNNDVSRNVAVHRSRTSSDGGKLEG